ncbi:MAG: hypothetical protein ACKVZ0_10215 [Gemmatimonadales bacterium]
MSLVAALELARPEGPGQLDPWVRALGSGRLVLVEVGFKPAKPDLIDGAEPTLEHAARALSRSPGRFVVMVPAERHPRFPPDTVLSRRRAEEALRRLLAAGSNPGRLVGLLQPPSLAPVEPGQARVELLRIN